MSCHDPVYANAPGCEHFLLFFDIHDTSSYLWRFKCNSAVKQVSMLVSNPVEVVWRHLIGRYLWSRNVYVNYSWQNIIRGVCKCHCACIAMTNRLIATWPTWVIHQVTSFYLSWGRFFQITLLLKGICVDACRREENNSVKYFLLSSQVQKLFAETLILPKSDIFMPLLSCQTFPYGCNEVEISFF